MKKTKYAIIFICVSYTLVIIEHETNILSRVSGELIQRLTPHPTPQTQQGLPSSEEPEENVMDANTTTSGGNKNILIYAMTRTGSTFVGELFNQHGDNMFYLYEPLHHAPHSRVAVTANGSELAGIHKDVLQGLFLCDFTPLEKFIRPLPKNHTTSEWFGRRFSMALCEKPVCPAALKDVWNQCDSCGPLNLALASQSCLAKEHRVIKTISLHRLDVLRPLVEDPRLELRVIQLVRDPRAMLASRMATFPDDYRTWKTWARQGTVPPEDDAQVNWLKWECDNARMSATVGLSRPRWLRRRYMLLRYEDVTRYPVQKAEEIYGFSGIPFSPRAREWILKNTQTNTPDSGPYSTNRNSLEQADKWRFSLPYELARVVQAVCGPTMELFGYSLVDDEKTLVNRSVSLLDPLYLV